MILIMNQQLEKKLQFYGENRSSNMFSIISGIDDSNPVIEHIVSVLTLLATVLLHYYW